MNAHKREEYKREIVELKAHVERLRKVAEMVYLTRFTDYEFAHKVLNETPSQSLQEHDRKVILDAVNAVHDKYGRFSTCGQVIEYANNLTNSEAG